MPVPKNVPKWAHVREEKTLDIGYGTVREAMMELSALPPEATIDTGYDEYMIDTVARWERVMTDDEYDKERLRRKKQREAELATKIAQEEKHRNRIYEEAQKLGLIE